jgi:hypothetical protein
MPPPDPPSIGRHPHGPDLPSAAAERQGLAIAALAAFALPQVPEVDGETSAPAGRRPAAIGADGGSEDDIVMAAIGDSRAVAGGVVDVAM